MLWSARVWKSSAKFEKDARRSRDYRSSRTRWHSKYSFNVGRVYTLRKYLVRGISLKTTEGGPQFWKQRCENTHTCILHTCQPTRLASEWYAIGYGSRKSCHRRIEITTNSPTMVESRWFNWTVITSQRIGNTHSSSLVLKEDCNLIFVYDSVNIYVLQELKCMCMSYQIVRHTDVA